jgi:rRNA small subunit pseudouridine methyltransferase Nep1
MPKEKRALPAEEAGAAAAGKKKKKSPQMVTVSPGAAAGSTSPAAASSSPAVDPQLSAASALAEPAAAASLPSKKPALIVVLERACLETGKVGKEHVLLNCDDHANFLRKHKRDPAESRPDILHQCMLILLDSPLNKAGLLRLYVKSEKGVLIEVSPSIRIPRTFRRFSGLMTQLLFKLSIRASNGPTKLLKVVKNPVTDHLPPNSKIHLLSVTGDLTSMPEWVSKNCPKNAKGALADPVVFVAGAMAHGKVEPDYDVDSCLAISEYPLSGAAALGRLCAAFENHLGVL